MGKGKQDAKVVQRASGSTSAHCTSKHESTRALGKCEGSGGSQAQARSKYVVEFDFVGLNFESTTPTCSKHFYRSGPLPKLPARSKDLNQCPTLDSSNIMYILFRTTCLVGVAWTSVADCQGRGGRYGRRDARRIRSARSDRRGRIQHVCCPLHRIVRS